MQALERDSSSKVMNIELKQLSVLQILPGHITEPKARLESKLAALSQFSHGALVSTACNLCSYRFSNFDVHLTSYEYSARTTDNLVFFLKCFKEAMRLKSRSGLDLIVCYDPLKTGLFGVLIKTFLGGKLVVEVNGVFGSDVLYRGKGLQNAVKKRVYPILQRWILNRADAVKYLFDDQLGYLRLKQDLSRYVFFDYTDIVPKEYLDNESNTILSVGFPSYIKGLDLLIGAFLKLSSQFPNWKLEIVGHFDAVEIQDLQNQIGANENVELRRPVPFSDIPGLIDNCSVLVLASRTEAMGRVLLEAMARSKPRIGSNVDGIPTVIEDRVDGLLFESNSVRDLAATLRDVMASRSLREKLGRNGYDRFLKEYTLDKYASLVKKMYFEVCEHEGP